MEKIGINDNFLELGGHSDLSRELAEKLAEQFSIALTAGIAITEPTIAKLSERIETLIWASQNMNDSDDIDDEDSEEFEL